MHLPFRVAAMRRALSDPPSALILMTGTFLIGASQLGELVGGNAAAGPAVLLLAVLGLAFGLAVRLRIRMRYGPAALVMAGALLGAVPALALVYDNATPLLLLGPMAFIVAVPHLRGRTVFVAATLAVAASVFETVASMLLEPIGPLATESGLQAILGVTVTAGAMVALSWRMHRGALLANERYADLAEDVPVGIIRTDSDGCLVEVNAAAVRLLGYPDRATMLATPVASLYANDDFRRAVQTQLVRDGSLKSQTMLRRFDGTEVWVRFSARGRYDGSGRARWFDVAIEDVSRERADELAHLRLASIVDSAGDSITTMDREGLVLTWNPAAERIYGWTAEEMVGSSIMRIVPPEDRAPLEPLMRRALGGERIGPIDAHRLGRDGRPVDVSLILSPIGSQDGTITSVSVIARDITEQLRLTARVERWRADREMVVRALYGLTPGGTAEESARRICSQVRLAGFQYASILALANGTGLARLGLAAEIECPAILAPLRSDRAAEIRRRLANGAWAEAVSADAATDLPPELGLVAVAYVPILHEEEPIGVLVVATGDGVAADLEERLAGLEELGAVVAPLLAPSLVGRAELAAARGRIEAILDAGAFHPVFQPIVDLRDGTPVGYEALTRFEDGRAPDAVFAEAERAGMGLRLEVATLNAQLEAAGPLPASRFLDLNVSPALVLAREPLRSILRASGFGCVVEITEHSGIPDYEAFRAAVAALGNVRLAIDDVGAGFSSLRHVLELRPHLIKIDRALVSGIDQDPARDALVAGLVHFADRIGARIVAEGIETEAERRAMLGAGVTLGQGYLFARPQRVEQLVAREPILAA